MDIRTLKGAPLTILSATLGELSFGHITIGSLAEIDRLLKRDLSPRALVAQVLHRHLKSPTGTLTPESFAALPDSELAAVAAAWAREKSTLNAVIGADTFAVDFRASLNALKNETSKATSPFSNAVQQMMKQERELARFNEIVTAASNASATAALGATVRLAQEMADVWRPPHLSTAGLEAMRSSSLFSNSTLRELARIGEQTAAMQRRIAAAIAMPDHLTVAANAWRQQFRMIDELQQVTRASFGVIDAWKLTPAIPKTLPAAIVEAPTLELHDASALTAAALAPSPENTSVNALAPRVHRPDSELLESMLHQWNPTLLDALRGARDRLQERGPDYIRQYLISLRELLRAALHDLAPNERAQPWIAAQPPGEHPLLHDGKPTRRARLLYLCDGTVGPQYAGFVAHIVRHHHDLVNFLDGGTHRIGTADEQLHALQELLLRRVEDLLIFLVALRGLR